MKICSGLLIILLFHLVGAGFFSGKLNFFNSDARDKEEAGFLGTAWSSVISGATWAVEKAKYVAEETPGFINNAVTTSTNKAKSLLKLGSDSNKHELEQEPTGGFFKDNFYYIRDKVEHIFASKDSTDDDAQSEHRSFNGYINSYWSSYTGWFTSKPVEECTLEWAPGNIDRLRSELQKLLYGQHLVNAHVPDMIEEHWHRKATSQKALVLSLHGSTGVGKNYVSQLLIDSLFKLGSKSKFVTVYSGRLDFPEESQLKQYQERLKHDLVQKVSVCHRHVFIFDEVDKVPGGVLNILKPFIDYNIKVRGEDFRNTTFIFMSNLGQNDINRNYMLLWKTGILRENVEYKQFEKILRDGVYNELGGLHHSDNIKHHLIDYYIPFLPMEVEHVKSCIEFAFEKHDMVPTEEEIERVHEFVDYGPEDNPIFSKTGCKSISSKVALIASYRQHRKMYRNTKHDL